MSPLVVIVALSNIESNHVLSMSYLTSSNELKILLTRAKRETDEIDALCLSPFNQEHF
jgi:hypothetical protein